MQAQVLFPAPDQNNPNLLLIGKTFGLFLIFLCTAVFINMGVWLLEQIVRIDFELLSVSYIVSELFLLLHCLLL